MRAQPLGLPVGLPMYGATKRVRGVPKRMRCSRANAATGANNGTPYGATKRVSGVPTWVR
eukprot:261148-Pyramimonas_sp.AAC.1